MRKSQRVTELEAKAQKSTHIQISVYYRQGNTYTTEDGKELKDEEIEELSRNDDRASLTKIIVHFV